MRQGAQRSVQFAHPRLGPRVDRQHDAIDIGRHLVGQQVGGGAQHRHALNGPRAARHPVIENAQHIEIAPLQRLADQGLGVPGRPDQHDIRRQGARGPPASDQIAPADMQGVQGDQRQAGPDEIGRDLRRGSAQEPAGDQGHDRAGRDHSGDRSEVPRRALAACEPVAAQRSHHPQHGRRAEGERQDPRHLGMDQGARRRSPGAEQADSDDGQGVEGAEIVGREPRGVALTRIQPDLGAKRSAPRGAVGHRLGRRGDGRGGQGLEPGRVQAAGTRQGGVERMAADGFGHGARGEGVPAHHARPPSLSR